MAKKSKHTILIICEGEKTESYFFGALRNDIIKKIYDIGDVNISIRPEPKFEDEDDDDQNENTLHKYPRKRKNLREASVGDEVSEGDKIPLPLKWVIEGQEELREGTFNEVWAVFDHDDHPTRKEAFEASKKVINGASVRIAFSSRCFEYYLLLHFERLYSKFESSECRDKNNVKKSNRKKLIYCRKNEPYHVDDCFGKKCIGGYARLKNYWVNSKGENSIYDIVNEKFELGFQNSAWLRYMSDLIEPEKEIYDRNPYINTDLLVKRLTGHEGKEWKWLSINTSYSFDNITIFITDKKEVKIKNNKDVSYIISENALSKVFEKTKTDFGKKLMLPPNEEVAIDILSYVIVDVGSSFILTLEKNIIMFDFNLQSTNNLSNLLYSLSHKELNELINVLKDKFN